MQDINWEDGAPFAITICDKEGVIIGMNKKSIEVFSADGGADLIGTNMLDCHPEPSKSQVKEMLNSQITNVYTIEKNGKKKLIFQSPYYENDEYKGLVELSLEIPFEMQHFVRKNSN